MKAGSTSQSVTVVLKTRGNNPQALLDFSTQYLQAYYSRNGAVSQIPLTSGGAPSWTAGRFRNMGSGIYTLDVPNAAFAVGAELVTIILSSNNPGYLDMQPVQIDIPLT